MQTLIARAGGIAVVLALSGCYGTDGERALGGAVVGALGASAISGSVAGGAVAGVLVGALADDFATLNRGY
ncbi:hypothetical protein [uncultured Jannaschia sp.]|uniref:hypothetical protein n=1 Tax=uncultured Jannaschia sp. TaxID=293347 RepID=UPI002603536F|nr:hypothetical protein [uncultured Jannaschia sp.]